MTAIATVRVNDWVIALVLVVGVQALFWLGCWAGWSDARKHARRERAAGREWPKGSGR